MVVPARPGRLRFLVPQKRSLAVRYGAALVGVLIASVLTYFLQESLTRTVLILFWPVVIVSAWMGGVGPAALASVLSIVIADYFLVPPYRHFSLARAEDVLPLLIFLGVSLVISYLVDAARRAQSEATEHATTNAALAVRLEAQAEDLAHQLEESQAMSEELEQSAEELEERSAAADEADRFSRSIVESISDPFVVFDDAWRFLFINAAAEEIFAASGHSEMTGQVVWEVYPALQGTEFEQNMRRAGETRQPVAFDAYYAETGEWSSTFCYPLMEGGVAAQWRNISERKRSEETARYLSIATATLASSLDYGETLARLASVVVPDLGDWCAVHLREGGKITQVAIGHVDPAKIEFAREVNAKHPRPDDSPTGVPNVMRTGQPEIYSDVTDEMLVAGSKDEEHLRITRELGIRSAIIAPLTSSAGVIGALTLVATDSGRRYSEKDLRICKYREDTFPDEHEP